MLLVKALWDNGIGREVSGKACKNGRLKHTYDN